MVGKPRRGLSAAPSDRYWCLCSFVFEGNWQFIRRETPATSATLTREDSVWATHELFLDQLRQQLGLERQTYTGAEFTFSQHCAGCGHELRRGFARCGNCGALRIEFAGLDRFVADEAGCCCFSGAETDVLGPDGNYYWAPYFIDRIRDGKIDVAT